MRTRVIIGIVAGIFFLCFISACFRSCGSPSRSRRPTDSRPTEPATRAEDPAEAEAEPEKSAPAPKKFGASHAAIDGIAELAEAGESSSAEITVASGDEATSRKEAHEIRETARWEEVKRTLTLDELTAKKAELEAAQEERAQLDDRMEMVRGYISHEKNLRDSYKSRVLDGGNPTARMRFRQLAEEKESKVQRSILELQKLQQSLKEVSMKIDKLQNEVANETGTNHGFVPSGG